MELEELGVSSLVMLGSFAEDEARPARTRVNAYEAPIPSRFPVRGEGRGRPRELPLSRSVGGKGWGQEA